MANRQRIARGFLYPVYVNETGNKKRISRGVYLNETITGGGTTFNQNVLASCSPTASMLRPIGKVVQASGATAAAIVRRTGKALQAASGHASSYEGLVATRAGMLYGFSGNQKVMSRSSHVAVVDIASLKIGWANTYYDGNGNVEATPTTTSTLIASVEYPAGNFVQFLWSGLTSKSVAPLTYVESDYATPFSTIPAGATFWIRIYNVSSGATCVGYAKNRNAGMGDLCNLNASSDQTMGGTITNSGSNWSPPAAIIGQTTQPSTIVPGDSTDYGPVDETTNLVDDFRRGKVCHGFPLNFAFLNHGNSGATVSGFLAGSTCRRQMWKYASHAIIGLGRNDLDAGNSSATIISNLQSIIIPQFTNPNGCTILFATTLPKSSSSNGWINDGGQITNGNNSVRVTLNTAARAGTITGISGFIETALSMESALNNGFWIGDNVTVNLNTADGLHQTAQGYITGGAAIAAEIVAKIQMTGAPLVATLVRQTLKIVRATCSPIGAALGIKSKLQSAQASASAVSSIVRQDGKLVLAQTAPVTSMVHAFGTTVQAIATAAASIVRQIARGVIVGAAAIASLNVTGNVRTQTVQAVVSTVASIGRTTSKVFQTVTAPISSLFKVIVGAGAPIILAIARLLGSVDE